MFDPVFYKINAQFDNNLTGYMQFVSGYDYVLRVIVKGWEQEAPKSYQIQKVAEAFSSVLASCGEIARYDVKSVCMQQVPNGTEVGYYDAKIYTIPVGNGYTDTLVADAGTWTLDLVFTAKSTEKSILSTSKWKTYLANGLGLSFGAPEIYIGGLIALDPAQTFSDATVQNYYSTAVSFWNGTQAYDEYASMKSSSSPSGYSYTVTNINKSGPAWTRMYGSPAYKGQDGFGLALGSAFTVTTLQPMVVTGTSMANPPPVPVDPSLPTPTDGSKTPPAGSEFFTDAEKQWLGFGIGAVAAIALFRLIQKQIWRDS